MLGVRLPSWPPFSSADNSCGSFSEILDFFPSPQAIAGKALRAFSPLPDRPHSKKISPGVLTDIHNSG